MTEMRYSGRPAGLLTREEVTWTQTGGMIAVKISLFNLIGVALLALHGIEEFELVRVVVGMGDLGGVLAQQLALFIAQHAAERRVHHEQAAIEGDLLDADGGLLVDGAEASLALQQRFLGALALGNIAQNDGVELLPGHLDLGDGGLDGKLLSVGPQCIENTGGGHGAGGESHLAEVANQPGVRGANRVRQEAVQRLAERVPGGTAEHLFGGLVEDDDALALVEGDDGIHGRSHDAGKALGADAQLFFALPALALHAAEHGSAKQNEGNEDQDGRHYHQEQGDGRAGAAGFDDL